MTADILKLYDDQGHLQAVQISPALWRRLEQHLPSAQPTVPAPGHDWPGFAEFEAAWNFPYAYDPAVNCPCGASTDNWRESGEFILKSANLGGLLVFHCNHCQGTVRQKYFKDHVAREFSPGAPCGPDGAK